LAYLLTKLFELSIFFANEKPRKSWGFGVLFAKTNKKQPFLGGGFKHFLFSSLPGEGFHLG